MIKYFLKIAVAGGFFAVLYQLFNTIRFGCLLRNYRGHRFARQLEFRHRRAARSTFWTMTASVIVTEITVRLYPYRPSPLFWVHVSCATLFFATVGLAVFAITGRRDPRLHRVLAYLTIPFYAVALPSGLVLLYAL
ncbi:MAG: hypothetical protein KGI59_01690 [Patescibacteria group bacterium]|nr:hypothetical protein [Patescibacteria group bacterium]MDE2172547.1 hypothetical protein [Patescibacteria group bacterium]